MDLRIPATITRPGGVEQTPFGAKPFSGEESTVTVTLHLDAEVREEISGLLNTEPSEHKSAAALAAEYSAAELAAALTLKLTA